MTAITPKQQRLKEFRKYVHKHPVNRKCFKLWMRNAAKHLALFTLDYKPVSELTIRRYLKQARRNG